MTFGDRIRENAVFIEFVAGSGLAVLFHLVLHKPDAAYSIFGIGILLSLGTYLIRGDLEKTRHSLSEQYCHSHELTLAISRIREPECIAKARDLLTGTIQSLAQLQKGCIPLQETEFYLEGAKCADTVRKRILAVDPMTSGWHQRASMVNFYQSNQRAVQRGVEVSRIFLMNRDELAGTDAQKILRGQLLDGIQVRVAFRDELPALGVMGSSEAASSYDFALFDDAIAAEVLPQPGTWFGYKTADQRSVEKLCRTYELIAHTAHSIVEEGGKIMIASPVETAAA